MSEDIGHSRLSCQSYVKLKAFGKQWFKLLETLSVDTVLLCSFRAVELGITAEDLIMAEEGEVVSSSRRPFPVVDSDSEVTKALVRFKHGCCIIILYVDLKRQSLYLEIKATTGNPTFILHYLLCYII